MDGFRLGTGVGAPSLWFDRLSGLLVAIERVTDDPILGDRSTETVYTRWEDAGGVMLPRQIDVLVNGRLQQHIVITTASSNTTLHDSVFVIADTIVQRAASAPAVAPPRHHHHAAHRRAHRAAHRDPEDRRERRAPAPRRAAAEPRGLRRRLLNSVNSGSEPEFNPAIAVPSRFHL